MICPNTKLGILDTYSLENSNKILKRYSKKECAQMRGISYDDGECNTKRGARLSWNCGKNKPVSQTTTPVARTTTPVARTITPVARTTVPMAQTTVSMEQTTVPMSTSRNEGFYGEVFLNEHNNILLILITLLLLLLAYKYLKKNYK